MHKRFGSTGAAIFFKINNSIFLEMKIIKKHLIQITAYNLWANRKIVQLIQNNPAEKFTQEVENSFPSIQSTLHHIWGAEQIWLSRLQGDAKAAFPTIEGDMESQFLQGLTISENFYRHVKGKKKAYYLTECEYRNTQGTAYSTPVQGIIQHTMNHSTYHRGQIITMARQLEFDGIESTDLITYLRK